MDAGRSISRKAPERFTSCGYSSTSITKQPELTRSTDVRTGRPSHCCCGCDCQLYRVAGDCPCEHLAEHRPLASQTCRSYWEADHLYSPWISTGNFFYTSKSKEKKVENHWIQKVRYWNERKVLLTREALIREWRAQTRWLEKSECSVVLESYAFSNLAYLSFRLK